MDSHSLSPQQALPGQAARPTRATAARLTRATAARPTRATAARPTRATNGGRPAKFWDRMARRYSKSPVADEAVYQKKLQVTREYLRPDMELLEIGCGTGSTAITHAPFVKHVHATDFSARMLEIAQDKAAAQGVQNITFEQASVEDLQWRSPLDMVLALSVLHLLERKEDAIAKVYAMLKPGGLFVSSTACLGDSMKIFKIIAPLGRMLGLLPIVKVFTVRELERSLREAGFAIEHQWQPGKNKGVFIVARKPLATG